MATVAVAAMLKCSWLRCATTALWQSDGALAQHSANSKCWDLRCIEPDVAWLAVRDSARVWPALQNEEHRVEEEEAETRVKLKAMREHHKKWEGTRDKRINSWRDFASNKKAKKTKPLGGIKPPKLKVPILAVAVCICVLRDVAVQGRCSSAKDAACFGVRAWPLQPGIRLLLQMEDEDRTFVQRSAVEQFKAAGKFTAPKCVVATSIVCVTTLVRCVHTVSSAIVQLNVVFALLQAAQRRGLRGLLDAAKKIEFRDMLSHVGLRNEVASLWHANHHGYVSVASRWCARPNALPAASHHPT
jgi:hypothetical protein